MILNHAKTALTALPVVVVTAMLFVASSGLAATPVKLIVNTHLGAKVDATNQGNICTVVSKDTCQAGEESTAPAGFKSPAGVAIAPNGDIYVAASADNRVQEFTSAGTFVRMFGGEVNETTKSDICTEEEIELSGVKCTAGTEGGLAGQINKDFSIAVDQATGNIYVQDDVNWRVDEYTASGQFVLMIGKEVNETKDDAAGATEAEKNLCAIASGDICKAGVRGTGNPEPGAFSFGQEGDLLAVGGPEGLLYVGDEHRVQEFDASGKWVREIPLISISAEPNSRVAAIAVAQTGDLYLAYGVNGFVNNVIHEFNPNGAQINEFEGRTSPEQGVTVRIDGLAVDSANRLAVTEGEFGNQGFRRFGSLYDGVTGHLITEFTDPGSSGIAFSPTGELYAAVMGRQEVVGYKSLPVAEMKQGPAVCTPGVEHETSATYGCILTGEVNPEEVAETKVRFEWGKEAALGAQTAEKEVVTSGTLLPVEAAIAGLRPNEVVSYRLAGNDNNVQLPEQLTSEIGSLITPLAPPKTIGEPKVSFVGSSAAVMFGELNPENADTRYRFQYGPCNDLENCPARAETVILESAVYGKINATLEARGLQAGTTYRYRLIAENESLGKTTRFESKGQEGEFETSPMVKVEAVTGLPSQVTSTSAVVSGSVNPDGQDSVYKFELGVYAGTVTQYGVVFSGSAGAGTAPVSESLALAGLQPGTTYAYRIMISSPGYGVAEGAPVTFTTAGLAANLTVREPLPMLVVPKIAFPKSSSKPKPKSKPKCKRGSVRNKHGKCVKTKHVVKGHSKKTGGKKIMRVTEIGCACRSLGVLNRKGENDVLKST
jgi:DNA-binding beta-propeller fold protein YncE